MKQTLGEHLQQTLAAEKQFPGTYTYAINALHNKLAEVQTHIDTLSPQESQGVLDLFNQQKTQLAEPPIIGEPPAPPPPAPTQPIATNTDVPVVPNPSARLITNPNDDTSLRNPNPERPIWTGDQARDVRKLPEPPLRTTPNEATGRIEQPVVQEKPFALTGHDTPQFTDKPTPAPFELEHSPGPGDHPGQGELPLHDGGEAADAAPAKDTKTGDLFAGGYGSQVPWQTRLRMGWKQASDGKESGFHQAVKTIIGAADEDQAAQMIRDKAADPKSNVAFSKLDAMHRALTGKSIEDHSTEAARTEARDAIDRARTDEQPADGGGTNAHAADWSDAVEPTRGPREAVRDHADDSEEVLASKENFANDTGATLDRDGNPRAQRNKPLTDALKKGDVKGAVQALATSKNEIIRRVGQLAASKLPRLKVEINDAKGERMNSADQSALEGYDSLRQRLHELDNLRALNARMPEFEAEANRRHRAEAEEHYAPVRDRRIERAESSRARNGDEAANAEIADAHARYAADVEKFMGYSHKADNHLEDVIRPEMEKMAATPEGGHLSARMRENFADRTDLTHVRSPRKSQIASGIEHHTVMLDGKEAAARERVAQGAPKANGDMKVAGSYDPVTKTVSVGSKHATDEGTFGHEVVHALTHEAIDKPTPLQKPVIERMQKLYEHVKQQLSKGSRDLPYAMQDLHEFVAEGMSNPTFQHELSRMQYDNSSAWRKFTSHIAKLLGLKEGNALTELLNLHEELHEATPADGGFTHNSSERISLDRAMKASAKLVATRDKAVFRDAVADIVRASKQSDKAGDYARGVLEDKGEYGITDAHVAEAEKTLADDVKPEHSDRKFFKMAQDGEFATPEGMGDKGLKEAGVEVLKNLKTIAAGGVKKLVFHNIPTSALVDGFSDKLPALRPLFHAIQDRVARQHELARGAAEVHKAIQEAYNSAGTLDRVNKALELAQISEADPRLNTVMTDAAVRNATADLEKAKLRKDTPKDVMKKLESAVADAKRTNNMAINNERTQNFLKSAKEAHDKLTPDSTPLDRSRAKDHLNRASAQAALHDLWGKMDAKEKAAFDSATTALRTSLETRTKALNDKILAARDGFDDPTLKKLRGEGASDEVIDKYIIDKYGKSLKGIDGAYAPFKRFGDWVTSAKSKEFEQAEAEVRSARAKFAAETETGDVALDTRKALTEAEEHLSLLQKDGDHRIVRFHESNADAKKSFDELKGDKRFSDVQRITRAEYPQHAPSISDSMMRKVIDALGSQLPDGLRKNMESIVRDLYIDAQPDGSFVHQQAKRAGVAGYNTDFTRGALDQLMRDSFQISALEHSETLGHGLKDLDAQRRGRSDEASSHIYDAIASRIDSTTDFKKMAKFEQRVSEVSHVFYLGASPGFLLMNMMQMPMITMPMLRARFGQTRPTGATNKAIGEIWSAIKRGDLDHTNSEKFTADEKEMLTRLQNVGILNMTTLHDTMTTAHSSNIIDPKTAGEHVAKGWDRAKDLANLPAQYIETVNRAASALAAYRLAREGSDRFGKMEHGAAMDYAAKIVRDSHVDYSATNNPAWLKTGNVPGARLLFQFKKYWLNMLSMTSMNMYDAFGHRADIKSLRSELADASLSEEARAEKQAMLDHYMERKAVARRTLAGLYAMHFIHTGALGMPFAGNMGAMTLANVMRSWYSDPEDKVNTEADIRNYLAHALGVDAGNVVMDGVWSGLFGMNIGQRIGMGDLATPMRMSDQAMNKKGAEFGKELLVAGAGPTAGLTLNMMQAFQQYEAGNYTRGTEKLLPKAAGDILKAVRRESDGGELSPSTHKLTAKTDEWDAIKQALGITPTHVAEAYKAEDAEKTERTQFMSVRNGLVKALAQQQHEGDRSAAADTQAKIDAFNQRNPQGGLRISMQDILKARKALTAPPKKLSVDAQNRNARFAAEGDFAGEE
jgi:hypothetical protein